MRRISGGSIIVACASDAAPTLVRAESAGVVESGLSQYQVCFGKAGLGGKAISAVGLTGQMLGLVLLDGAGNVLRPAILWNDLRTLVQCDEIHRRVGRERFICLIKIE